MLCAIQEQFTMDGMTVGFSMRKKSSGPNGLFTCENLNGMLKCKDYSAVD